MTPRSMCSLIPNPKLPVLLKFTALSSNSFTFSALMSRFAAVSPRTCGQSQPTATHEHGRGLREHGAQHVRSRGRQSPRYGGCRTGAPCSELCKHTITSPSQSVQAAALRGTTRGAPLLSTGSWPVKSVSTRAARVRRSPASPTAQLTINLSMRMSRMGLDDDFGAACAQHTHHVNDRRTPRPRARQPVLRALKRAQAAQAADIARPHATLHPQHRRSRTITTVGVGSTRLLHVCWRCSRGCVWTASCLI